MIGMHGTCTANHAIQNCDLIFAAGVRFDDRATGRLDKFAPLAKVIHIDVDPAEIGKNVSVDVPIVGDARIVLRQILEVLKIKIKEVGKPSYKAWHKKIAEWRKKYPLKYPQDNLLRPQYVVETISKLTRNRETIITTGVGQNQMWAAQYYKAEKPRRFLTSGGLGTMGYGFPAAIGAQVACQECLVVTIDGDGSFQMVLQDLATVKAYSLPVKVVILNNGYLGMVRQWQELFYKKKYMAVFLAEGTPDFVKLAEAYDLEGYLVERKSDLEPTLKKAFNSPKAAIVDVRVNQEENVFPMVPAGCALDEIIVEGEQK
jgi:acetolactate synthase-1/2/3 large subunit